jgi:hypothetical protein
MIQEVNNIRVEGRRYYDGANTYCSSRIYVNGYHVATCEYEYGYGDYYMQAAADKLLALGFMPGRRMYPHGGGEALSYYCRDRGIELEYGADDVKCSGALDHEPFPAGKGVAWVCGQKDLARKAAS